MNMAEMLLEQGQSQCVNYKGYCNMRPCTSAQGVFCCKECEFGKNCVSKCRKISKHGNK